VHALCVARAAAVADDAPRRPAAPAEPDPERRPKAFWRLRAGSAAVSDAVPLP
jgi:hypothetical protein